MTLHIKNMVCDRCILVVRQQLENLNFQVIDIVLGIVNIEPEPEQVKLSEISSALRVLGFELIDNTRDQLIDRIKTLIIEKIHHGDLTESNFNFSSYLAVSLGKDYAYLSRRFSETEDITVERFIIQQKVEKVKEFIEYRQLNLNEIAMQLGYSSSAHLSTQFKQVTGFTPSQYKVNRFIPRTPVDKISTGSI